MVEQNRRFQILSLDGGGIKGIFSAVILAKIEEDLNVNITDHFDLIAGTSTGGIIALGLGLGLRPAEILKFYTENGNSIFSWPRLRTTGRYPHYHRNVPDPMNPGQSIPGQGIGRHRPWDVKSPDKSFWDRF